MKGGGPLNLHSGHLKSMVKKELGLRARRRIYEDTICLVAQTQKMSSSTASATRGRAVDNLIEKQTDRCVSILMTVLGYHETVSVSADGIKKIVLLPEDNDEKYAIEKSKFEDVIQKLPTNKELKEALWKAFIKRDKKATEKLDTLVA